VIAVVKMVIVMRSDLGLRKGEIAAQVAHAAMKWLCERIKAWRHEDWSSGSGTEASVMTPEEDEWVLGTFTKIVLRVDSAEELAAIGSKAIEAGLTVRTVEESNLGGKVTCIGIGPHEAEKIDPITGHLRPYS